MVAIVVAMVVLGPFLSTAPVLAKQAENQPCPSAPAGSDQPCPTAPASELGSELPPADLPTTNEQGYSFQLESNLTVGLAQIPRQAPIYELQRDAPTRVSVEVLASRLGLTGEVEERDDATFFVSGGGDLFVSTDLIQFLSDQDAPSGELPTDEDAIEAAREWLRQSGLSPADLGEGRVVTRSDNPGRVVITFNPLEPPMLLAAYPSITVTLGPESNVLEASFRWAIIRRSDLYQLRDPERAWDDVAAGQSYLEVEFGPDGPAQGSTIEGDATYERVDVAYTSAGPPGGQQYLLPVYVFTGRLTLPDSDVVYPIKAYVVALADSGAPVGSAGGAA